MRVSLVGGYISIFETCCLLNGCRIRNDLRFAKKFLTKEKCVSALNIVPRLISRKKQNTDSISQSIAIGQTEVYSNNGNNTKLGLICHTLENLISHLSNHASQ